MLDLVFFDDEGGIFDGFSSAWYQEVGIDAGSSRVDR